MLYNVRRKVTETLINSQTIADAQVCDEIQSTQKHRGFIRGPCYCPSPLRDDEKPKTEVEKKNAERGGQAEVEDEKEGQREKREKGTRGKNKKEGG